MLIRSQVQLQEKNGSVHNAAANKSTGYRYHPVLPDLTEISRDWYTNLLCLA